MEVHTPLHTNPSILLLAHARCMHTKLDNSRPLSPNKHLSRSEQERAAALQQLMAAEREVHTPQDAPCIILQCHDDLAGMYACLRIIQGSPLWM